MMPVLRRTWAPCGTTPLLAVRARSHEKVSGIGALIVSPHRRQITLALALYPGMNIRGPQVLRFLRHLARHVRGPFVLVWDRGRSHQHALVRDWVAAHPRCHIVWFHPTRQTSTRWNCCGVTSSTAASRTLHRTPSTTFRPTSAENDGVWPGTLTC
jgi:hypothetical protein